MNHTEFLSTRKFLENCHNGDMLSSDIYDFIEAKTNLDLNKLENLKGDILQYKGMLVMNLLPEIQESPKYKEMEKSGEFIPIMTNASERIRQNPEKPDQGEIFINELQDFIEMFIPYRYANLEQVESIINDLIEHEQKKNKGENKEGYPTGIEWKGTDLELTELVKALIESKKVKIKSQKHFFDETIKFFNMKEFNVTKKIQQIKNRTKETPTFLYELAGDLEASMNK
tara:strand:+ start:1804 stop:2487 length:684 start_codon:yes stop_codon:yes gene_type:complete